jgi:hypothetical protein|tara:strand:- start:404 stop:673 length:270 start_codon:yes stop_codon:yes gene_type:complete
MTQLERAARALAKVQKGTDDWESLDEQLQQTLKDQVRAVLEAIRIPSYIQTRAGQHTADLITETRTSSVWQTMVDVILTEVDVILTEQN